MAEAMDGVGPTGLPAGDRRETRKNEILEWWSAYRGIKSGGARGLEVRDKSDGSNRYGVIPWDVPLRDQGPQAECEQQEPEAVHNGYTYRQFGSRRERDGRRRAERQRKGPVV